MLARYHAEDARAADVDGLEGEAGAPAPAT
jgi:hypothetical protein